MPKPAVFLSRAAVELRALAERMGREVLRKELKVTRGVVDHWIAADRRPDALNMQKLDALGIATAWWWQPADKRRARTGTEG